MSMTTTQESDDALAALGRSWTILLFLGIVSLLLGVAMLVWPGATIVVVAVLLAVWLLISGIFQIVRAFGSGWSGGMRALLIITGILSIAIALFAFRGFRLEDSPVNAVWILAVLIGVSFLFRGMGALFAGIESKEGRGWNIFGGNVMLIGGVVIISVPGLSLATLAIVTGAWLVVIGIFEIVGAFRLRSLAKA